MRATAGTANAANTGVRDSPAVGELVTNPRVFFDLHDLPRLRERITAPPYSGWYRSIRQQVDALRRPEFYRSPEGWRRTDEWLEVRHLQRSGIAMRAAFLAALTEEAIYRDLALL
ncbi:MAG: hypothetical protein ACRDI2_22415, partial [Chloroflexota bacterium]